MKTSNKMLLSIAIALIVIPISIVVFLSLTGRVDYDEYRRGIATEAEDLNTEDRLLSTTKLEKFKDVKFSSSKPTLVHLHLIHSKEDGININNQSSDAQYHEIDE